MQWSVRVRRSRPDMQWSARVRRSRPDMQWSARVRWSRPDTQRSARVRWSRPDTQRSARVRRSRPDTQWSARVRRSRPDMQWSARFRSSFEALRFHCRARNALLVQITIENPPGLSDPLSDTPIIDICFRSAVQCRYTHYLMLCICETCPWSMSPRINPCVKLLCCPWMLLNIYSSPLLSSSSSSSFHRPFLLSVCFQP